MAVLTLDLYSYELGMNNQVSMILPERRGVPVTERNGKPYPVLYLLHGHSQDHTSWLRLTRCSTRRSPRSKRRPRRSTSKTRTPV